MPKKAESSNKAKKAKKKRPAVQARKEAQKKQRAAERKQAAAAAGKGRAGGRRQADGRSGEGHRGHGDAHNPQGGRRFEAQPQVNPDSRCPVSHQCGACSRIDQDYPEQLADKQRLVVDLFANIAGEETELCPIKGMADPFHYRNKVMSPFAPGKPIRGKAKGKGLGKTVLTGMYAAGTHRLVDTSGCLLENQTASEIIRAIKQLMSKFGYEPYNENTGEGFIRHAVIRVGHNSGEVLVTLVTNDRVFPGSKGFARELVKRVPAITTVVQNVNTRNTNVVLGDEEHTVYGPGFILDTLCGLSFRISSTSFYQVSAGQTEVLYQTAIDMAQMELDEGEGAAVLPENPVVLDAYCGTGTIGLVAASQMEGAQVIGVDSVASAISDARLNAAHNGIENAEFTAGDAGQFMRQRAAEGMKLDLLFMDPPRSGSDESFLEAAVEASPVRIVYISCNPVTQARDVSYLVDHGYDLRIVQPVDMFPHTDHVENICLLSKVED